MNKCIITNAQGTETYIDKEFSRMASKQDGVSVFLKGGFDKAVNSLDKNKLLNLKLYLDDELIMDEIVTIVSYNFLVSVSTDGNTTAVMDNTILFNLMK